MINCAFFSVIVIFFYLCTTFWERERGEKKKKKIYIYIYIQREREREGGDLNLLIIKRKCFAK